MTPTPETPEPVRVGRFEWERLMLSSKLPRATKSILLIGAVFMSADGSRMRPGVKNLELASGKGRSTVIAHLDAAVEAGYLIRVERGGYRRGSTRASEYAASVPASVFAERRSILSRAPWGASDDAPTSENLDVDGPDEGPDSRTLADDEGPKTWTFTDHERPIPRHEGPVFRSRRSENLDPITQLHHVLTTTPSPLPPVEDPPALVGEILNPEEGEKIDQESRIKTLTDEVRSIRPNWPLAKIRQQVDGALQLLDGNLDAVRILAVQTAADPSTQFVGRITADGNPHLTQARAALMIAKFDAMPDVPRKPPMPGAHEFVPDGEAGRCARPDCEMPESNRRHNTLGEPDYAARGARVGGWSVDRQGRPAVPGPRLPHLSDDGVYMIHPDGRKVLVNSHANVERYNQRI